MNIKPEKGNVILNIAFTALIIMSSIKTAYQISEQWQRRKMRKQCNCEKRK